MRASALLLLAVAAAGSRAEEFAGDCVVGDDASMTVAGRHVVLADVLVPRAARDCARLSLPAGCGLPAAAALRARARGTVRCIPRGTGPVASCRVDEPRYATGLDLAAWLVEQGWALPLPAAPFEYHVLERLARQTGRGLFAATPGVSPTLR